MRVENVNFKCFELKTGKMLKCAIISGNIIISSSIESYAGQIEFEAWDKCAIEKAETQIKPSRTTQDAHSILGQCASYQFNYMLSLRQEGNSDHQMFVIESQAESKVLSDVLDVFKR